MYLSQKKKEITRNISLMNMPGLWRIGENMPTKRGAAAATVVNNKIYVIGGLYSGVDVDKCECYDPSVDVWTTKQSLPVADSGMTCASVNGKIYLNGLKKSQDVQYCYDTITDTWSSLSPMPVFSACPASALVDDKIYVLGGSGYGGYSKSNYCYDPTTDTWSTKSPILSMTLGSGNVTFTASSYTDKIYFFVGSIKAFTLRYDTLTDTWSYRGPTGDGNAIGSLTYGNNIYILFEYRDILSIKCIEAQSDLLYILSIVPKKHYMPAFITVNNFLYVIGSHSPGVEQLVEMFNPLSRDTEYVILGSVVSGETDKDLLINGRNRDGNISISSSVNRMQILHTGTNLSINEKFEDITITKI